MHLKHTGAVLTIIQRRLRPRTATEYRHYTVPSFSPSRPRFQLFLAVLSGKIAGRGGLNIDAPARNAVALIALPVKGTVAPRYCNDGEGNKKKGLPGLSGAKGGVLACMSAVRFPWNWLGLERSRLCLLAGR